MPRTIFLAVYRSAHPLLSIRDYSLEWGTLWRLKQWITPRSLSRTTLASVTLASLTLCSSTPLHCYLTRYCHYPHLSSLFLGIARTTFPLDRTMWILWALRYLLCHLVLSISYPRTCPPHLPSTLIHISSRFPLWMSR